MCPEIAFATCDKYPELTADDRLVIAELRERGISVSPLIWDAEQMPAQNYSSIVVRSCWDYHYRPQQFLAWIRQVQRQGTALWNPAHVIEWNMRKTCLRDLQERGVTIPETIWCESPADLSLAELLTRQSWPRAVVKPLISATAFRTFITTPETAPRDEAEFAVVTSASGAMVQQFIAEVQTRGEWSLIFFAGRYSHAVLKRARAGDFRVQEEYGGFSQPAQAPARMIAEAEAILDLIGEPLLFARVDGVECGPRFVLMELELIEPHLFLGLDAQAPRRFADAIASQVTAGGISSHQTEILCSDQRRKAVPVTEDYESEANQSRDRRDRA